MQSNTTTNNNCWLFAWKLMISVIWRNEDTDTKISIDNKVKSNHIFVFAEKNWRLIIGNKIAPIHAFLQQLCLPQRFNSKNYYNQQPLECFRIWPRLSQFSSTSITDQMISSSPNKFQIPTVTSWKRKKVDRSLG